MIRSHRALRTLLFFCFVVSGFTALAYQTVWMRLALARFGVNASVVASVLAVFMLGLAAGSFGAGRLLSVLERRFGLTPLRVYGAAELLIAAGGIAVPFLFDQARRVLLGLGPASGATYSVVSAIALAATLLPFCAAMGVTFPSAIAALARAGASGARRDPFGALYLLNVFGALVGTVVTSGVLIEIFGFLTTSRIAAAGSAVIGLASLAASTGAPPSLEPERRPRTAPAVDPAARARRLALFATGASTLGLEVVWMRMYPALIGTFVYSFAIIVASYLLATTAGSLAYRALRRRGLDRRLDGVWPWLVAAAVLPLFSASVTVSVFHPAVRVFLGLAPLCALLGMVTPMLVDREAGDDAARVGAAYGINLVGCLIGPVVTGFLLLPILGTRGATLVLIVPLAVLAVSAPLAPGVRWRSRLAATGAALALWLPTTLFEEKFERRVVRHDHVATVVAADDGAQKHLYVNGVGMTHQTTITKMMAHFPAAHLSPRGNERLEALVICFGMGTSFRSLASWGADVTAVELVPSVADLFGFFFPGGPQQVARSQGRLRIVKDDGRRFLDRTPRRFDLITLDPPPPVEAAGSSLLYSKELYVSARARMKPGAILHTWIPSGDGETVVGVLRSVAESFPYVRLFTSVDGWGLHVLASEAPIPRYDAATLAARVPKEAAADMTEWTEGPPTRLFQTMLERERRLPAAGDAITDDRPLNEFYLLRRLRRHFRAGAGAPARPAAAAPR